MNGFSNAENNAYIRGYILRNLVRGMHFSMTVKSLSNKMVKQGIIVNPDISDYLYYLHSSQLIEFTDMSVTPFNALEKDAVVRLSVQGIRFIENGGEPEMGIDL